MIDHISIAVSNLAASAGFYEQVLGPLGLRRLVERPATVGFGKSYPELWLNARPAMVRVAEDTGNHICLRALDEAAVRSFHAAALAGGGRNAGEPGPRQAAITGYFAAFVYDLDGNKLEAATFPKKPGP
jgi:catechol 2,3-dioxygenase-like lactoylglutathione lyase family enzyme